MRIRAIRGAITVDANDKEEILEATRTLLQDMIRNNSLDGEDIISIIFTATPDLDQVFPAQAARELGWTDIPLLCACEIDVEGALPRCIRILLHAHSEHDHSAIDHIYLRDAKQLRPDVAGIDHRERV